MKIIKIMFVCHGNICRSPMAEFVFKKIVEDAGNADGFMIASSATSTEEIYHGQGNPVYPPARRELAMHGILCEGKYAVQIKSSDYGKYDYIVVMDDNNLRNIRRIIGEDTDGKVWKLYDFAPCAGNPDVKPDRFSGHDISDPWYTGDFSQAYDDIELGCRGLYLFTF